jgi:CAAX protease family protein
MNLADHVLAVIICILAPVMAFSSRNADIEEVGLESEDKIRLYHSNALLLSVFALVVITIWRLPGRALAGLGFEWPHWSPILALLMVSVFLFYALDIFFQYGLRRWREKTLRERHNALTFVPADSREMMHFIFLALAAGIGEEIIFRGYLIHYLLYWTGNTLSGIITACFFASALFAFLHGYQGIKSMVKIFVLALLFSSIFILSQSLLLVMIIHTVIDMLSGWLGIYILRYLRDEDTPENKTKA